MNRLIKQLVNGTITKDRKIIDRVEIATALQREPILEPETLVSDGILTSEKDVHFTVIIDKKGNKTL